MNPDRPQRTLARRLQRLHDVRLVPHLKNLGSRPLVVAIIASWGSRSSITPSGAGQPHRFGAMTSGN
jgi:hypothetical protein